MKNNDIIQTIESCPVADMFQEKELTMSGRKCSFEDCTKKHDSHGFCSNHAFQFRKYGHPLTKEEKHENNSKAAKARLKKYGHHNLGKRWTLPEEKKNKKGVTYNTGKTHFKKGQVAPNKGVKLSQETRDKISKSKTKLSDLEKLTNKQLRSKSRKLRNLVFARDNDTCQVCFTNAKNPQADHIKRWSEYPELRFDIDNIRTLCMACHYFVTYKRKLPQDMFWGHRRTI